MKKVIILAVVLMMVPAVSALADSTYNSANDVLTVAPQTSTPTTPQFRVELSKNVSMTYVAAASGAGYMIYDHHTSGTRAYGSSSGDSKIYYNADTAAAPSGNAPTGTATADYSSWTAM